MLTCFADVTAVSCKACWFAMSCVFWNSLYTSLNCFFTRRCNHVVRTCWKGFNRQIASEEPLAFVKISLPLILLGPWSSEQEDPEAWPWLAQNLCGCFKSWVRFQTLPLGASLEASLRYLCRIAPMGSRLLPHCTETCCQGSWPDAL